MSKRQKSGLLYLAAASFCIIAGIFNIKNNDIVFVVMAFIAGIVFAAAGLLQMKYAKDAAIAARTSKNNKSKNKGTKRK